MFPMTIFFNKIGLNGIYSISRFQRFHLCKKKKKKKQLILFLSKLTRYRRVKNLTDLGNYSEEDKYCRKLKRSVGTKRASFKLEGRFSVEFPWNQNSANRDRAMWKFVRFQTILRWIQENRGSPRTDGQNRGGRKRGQVMAGEINGRVSRVILYRTVNSARDSLSHSYITINYDQSLWGSCIPLRGITGGKTKATLLRYAATDELPCFTSCHFLFLVLRPFFSSFFFLNFLFTYISLPFHRFNCHGG